MAILILIFIILFLGAISFFLKHINPATKRTSLTVLPHLSEGKTRDQVFEVEIADTMLSRAKGLSGKDNLDDHKGMLFLFDKAGSYGFWMKDMKFPIDIIWIKGTRIAGFSERVQPEPKKTIFGLPVYYPPEPVDKVLELNSGSVERYHLEKGDEVNVSS